MRQLRACDFCGERADGVYEPLPPEFAADQRRVALCAACRDTLEELLAPLDGTRATTPSVTIDEGEREDDGPTKRPDSGEPTDTDPEPEGSTGAGDRDSDGGEKTEADADEAGAEVREEPPGFRKVMRLLNNRSFPLERSAAIGLASGAYDLSEAEVEATIDHAVERGVLEASGDELRRA